jgi:hypothetical protein
MKAVKATYENGKITLSETPPEPGPMEVLVVFPEAADDPWQQILGDPTPRPALTQWVKEVEEEIARGKATPLDPEQL